MKKVLFLLVFTLLTMTSNAQANKQDVKTFLELSGYTLRYNTMVDQILGEVSTDKRDLLRKDMEGFVQRMVKEDVNKYAAAFTQDEILKLIEFYKSPLGKKLVVKTELFYNMTPEEEERFQLELQGIVMKYMM